MTISQLYNRSAIAVAILSIIQLLLFHLDSIESGLLNILTINVFFHLTYHLIGRKDVSNSSLSTVRNSMRQMVGAMAVFAGIVGIAGIIYGSIATGRYEYLFFIFALGGLILGGLKQFEKRTYEP